MLYKSLQFDGLRIVVNPEKRLRDPVGNPVKHPGKHIQFVNGTYRLGQRTDITEKEEIGILDDYAKKYPGELEKIDDKKLAAEKKFIDKAKVDAEKDWKERLKKREKNAEMDQKGIQEARDAASKETGERKAKEAEEKAKAEAVTKALEEEEVNEEFPDEELEEEEIKKPEKKKK